MTTEISNACDVFIIWNRTEKVLITAKCKVIKSVIISHFSHSIRIHTTHSTSVCTNTQSSWVCVYFTLFLFAQWILCISFEFCVRISYCKMHAKPLNLWKKIQFMHSACDFLSHLVYFVDNLDIGLCNAIRKKNKRKFVFLAKVLMLLSSLIWSNWKHAEIQKWRRIDWFSSLH